MFFLIDDGKVIQVICDLGDWFMDVCDLCYLDVEECEVEVICLVEDEVICLFDLVLGLLDKVWRI